mgnify:CR=1 FL=1
MREQQFQSLESFFQKQWLEIESLYVPRKMKAITHDTEYGITERQVIEVSMPHCKIGTVRDATLQSDTVSSAPARATSPTGTRAWNAQSDGPA